MEIVDKHRCPWPGEDPLCMRYHDEEWGVPLHDDRALFEFLILETFQAGLSWITVLRKRENFRAAFDGFDFERIARYDASDEQRLLGDAGIVRHRGKIRSTINNAQRAMALRDEHGSLASYFWGFEPGPQDRPAHITWEALKAMTTTPASKALAKDLERRGWSFVGPTTAYAFMQAMGLVNDHMEGCDARQRCIDARARRGG